MKTLSKQNKSTLLFIVPTWILCFSIVTPVAAQSFALQVDSLKNGFQNDFQIEKLSEKSLGEDSEFTVKEVSPYPEYQLNGYLKYLPSYRKSPSFENAFFDQLLHNRFNLRANFNEKWTAYGSLRTRFFIGSSVKEFPFFKDFLEEDFGFFNISKVLWSGNNFMLHSTIDRFFTEYRTDKWQVRIGRQRINWGINLVSNPNDLFNTYSFFDFDYEERPGTDAIRVSYFTGDLSRIEFAVAPGRTKKESVAAVYYSLNHRGYDLQFISGYFKDRWTGGFGWAGSIKDTGFKGEFSYFRDLNPIPGREAGNFVVSTSVDHMFGNGIFLVVEYLYNQPRKGSEQNVLLLTRPLQADNLSFTDHSVFVQGTYPISPILNAGLAGFYYPTDPAVFISPSFTGNVLENLDLLLIGQFFVGGSGSIFEEAGSLIAAALKWSF
ncbi:hypothetical protein [Cecembia lonarensis]|uniref:Alginate export domain-containing protein n=1 Tax=Cecembia lonarensis (strain CCUG 58316 / KCTC 22772 / LW9) TaxID=1225176 RepID=K1LE99_CECL9|nr:hypothetical protein [Cecembia lonarensis]EKB50512.1 hypothetical protein B879_00894 [Cecembia lonarensis LW9]